MLCRNASEKHWPQGPLRVGVIPQWCNLWCAVFRSGYQDTMEEREERKKKERDVGGRSPPLLWCARCRGARESLSVLVWFVPSSLVASR